MGAAIRLLPRDVQRNNQETMNRRTKIFLLIGCLISVVAHFRWFNSFGFLANGDWRIQLSESAAAAFQLPQLWGGWGLGGVNVHAPFYLLHLIHGGLASLGLSFGVVERLAYLWPITIFSVLGAFLLIRRVTKSDIGAFVGSLVYAFSVYFLLIQTQHIYIMLADALAPLAILAYLNVLDRRRLSDVIWAGLAFFVVSSADFRIFYILALAFSFYAAARAIHEGAFKSFKKLLVFGVFAASPFVLAVLLNMYWIIGFSSTTTLTSNQLLNRPIFGGGVAMTRVLNLHSGAWTGGATEWFGKNPVPWWFWTYSIAAVMGFWVARRKRFATLFLFLALFAAFFGKMTGLPFGEAYTWMYENFPGFNAFREASKFKFLLIISYATLIGFFVAWLRANIMSPGWRRYVKIAVIAILIALPIWNTKPLITGEIGTLYVEREMPADYARFNDHLRAEKDDFFRVLWLPRHNTWTLAKYHPRLSSGHIKAADDVQLALENSEDQEAPREMKVVQVVASELGNAVMDLQSVRYIGVPLIEDQRNPFKPYHIDRDEVIQELYTSPYLTRPALGLEQFIVFENEEYRPRVYVTREPERFDTIDQEVIRIENKRLSSTEHVFSVHNVSGEIYVNFTETYHPNWYIYSNELSWWQRFTAQNTEQAGVEHEESWVGFNQFRVNTEEYCSLNDCHKNDDGTYSFGMTLFFQPQRHFFTGVTFSFFVLLACLAYLGIDRSKRSNNKIDGKDS